MKNATLQQDIATFKAAAELLGIRVRGKERRQARRHRYEGMVSVGPYIGGKAATESLLPVRCKDVSGGGISFLFPRLDSKRLILVRLNAEEPISLVARVVRQVPVDAEGFACLISCQFVARP
jgi:hypothetical protein